MILTITFLVAAFLQPTTPTVVTELKPQSGPTIQLQPKSGPTVQLQPAQPTIVKTWAL